jgi:uncharacterized protein (DUF924 family)
MSEMAEEILRVWLEEIGPGGWYTIDPALDARLRARFEDAWAAAAAGRLDHWIAEPRSALALVILLDQLPRNMFRGTPRAFASDALARRHAKRAIDLGHDRRVPEPGRQFFYLPLMHSEWLTDQERCVRLIRIAMPDTGAEQLDHATRHRDVIRRFGRFPSRNPILGRADTPEERAYREAGGYMA